MRYTNRTIRVSIPYIQQAMASKEEFEAVAFCLFMKLNFTSSEIHNATVRRLKELTHLGSDKLKRLTNYCMEHGMINITNGTMIFNKLCQDGRYLYKFRYSYIKRNKKHKMAIRLTLAKVKDMLRRAVLANHIRKVENIREQALLTKNPKTASEYRKGRSIVRRLSVWGLNFFISNKRLAEIAKCSVSKARNIKKAMLSYGEIESTFSNTLVFDNAQKFNINEYNKYYDDACFLFVQDGKVYKHNPNIYNYKGQNIMFVPKKNK